jgi:hypothetical protein
MAFYTTDQKVFVFKSCSYSGGSWRLHHRESSVLVVPSRQASGLLSRSKKQDASVIDVRRGVKFGIYVGVEVLTLVVMKSTIFWDAGLENRDFGRRGSAALTMRHPSIRKSWY